MCFSACTQRMPHCQSAGNEKNVHKNRRNHNLKDCWHPLRVDFIRLLQTHHLPILWILLPHRERMTDLRMMSYATFLSCIPYSFNFIGLFTQTPCRKWEIIFSIYGMVFSAE